MPLEFHKMHGAGNDFVLIDARAQEVEPDAPRVRRIADRHFGVGCDQLIILHKPRDPADRVRYEIWNSDGSRAGQCGNGARCVGLFLHLAGEVGSERFTLESPAGRIVVQRCDDGEYEVGMGVPDFDPGRVPVNLEPENGRYRIDSTWGSLEFSAVSMGNPHALVVVPDLADAAIPQMGAFLGTHPAFPEGCNIGFAELESSRKIRLRVVERGAGETLACGSGACAAMAILRQSGLVDDVVEVLLPGGRLVIKWSGNGAPLTMKGPAEHVFRGIMNE